MTDETVDLVVVGAGIYGIQAARTYLAVHPHHHVIVIEADHTIGGVWSSGKTGLDILKLSNLGSERVYDAFMTQTSKGILEFSDLPLDDIDQQDLYHGFFPARYVVEYLQRYAETRQFGGRSLFSRIQLAQKVTSLTKADGLWVVRLQSTDETLHSTTVRARRVIDASGLTSEPNLPNILHRDVFQGLVFHQKEFGRQQASVFSEKCDRVAVIGGAKSAADIVYACAKAGKSVSWIIRASGAGPAAFVSAKGRGMYQNSNESFYTRFTSHFLVSHFFDEEKTWLGRFLYKTRIGRFLIKRLWTAINLSARNLANYDRSDGQANGFYNLKPDTAIFWQNDSTGIIQHDDFFDTVAQNVRVYREDVESFCTDGLELVDGQTVSADIIVYATGWTPSHPCIVDSLERDLHTELGLISKHDGHFVPERSQNSDRAKALVLVRFPMLSERPIKAEMTENECCLRLYKGILPVHDRSIAFVGQLLLGNNFRVAEVQALYAVAALDGTLALPPTNIMDEEIAMTIAWDRLRYLGKGRHGNWLYWDMVPYTDNLLEELGLFSHRHKSGWKDMFSPCFARDLRGLIEEYKRNHHYDVQTTSSEGIQQDSRHTAE